MTVFRGRQFFIKQAYLLYLALRYTRILLPKASHLPFLQAAFRQKCLLSRLAYTLKNQ
jgi:hypothetical protein